MGEMQGAERIYRLTEIEYLKVHGRTTGERSPLTLFWTGSGIELNVTGSRLAIELETDYEQYEQWISIWINEVEVSRLMLPKGRHWLTIFRGMNENTTKNIRIYKEVQAMSADEKSLLQVYAIKSNGGFMPVQERPYRLEFIGDSITSGEGGIGSQVEQDWIPMWFSASRSYTKLTAEALNADYRVLSQSGWGVLTSWDNNPHAALPLFYEQICGLLNGVSNEQLGAKQLHDFSSWQPHVVIVNLGTNDSAAFHGPAWRDDITGQERKLRLLSDGSYHPDDLSAFEEAAVQFLHKLRSCNPSAHIVWAYGMLGDSMLPALYRAVDRYAQQTLDNRVSVFQLPDMTEQTVGARSHPGQLAHAKAADQLSHYITSLIC